MNENAKEFMNMMMSMNNGLDRRNPSTLKETYVATVKLGARINSNSLTDVTEYMLPEAAFNRRHPGLDETVNALQNTIESMVQSQSKTM